MFHKDKSNPFKYYDPRGLRCYENLKVPDNAIIPTTDDGAWEYFKQHRWVYNKIDIAQSQNLVCAPIGLAPEKFPVFMKPLYNLHGAGIGSYVLKSEEDYKKYESLSGYFWMEYLTGDHLSHDTVVINGEIVYHLTFKGHSLGQGMFDYWETIETPKEILDYVSLWVRKNLKSYMGFLNVETIGSKIIECHLRMGDIDRLGNLQLMQNIVDVYNGSKWAFSQKIPKFYLFALWGDWNVNYTIDEAKAREICKNLTCYQIDQQKLFFQNPPGGIRLAIVSSYNKEDCINARNGLYENFAPKPRKPKINY